MNGAATVHPLNVPAKCKCGHDRLQHGPTQCNGCIGGGVPHGHGFVGEFELESSAASVGAGDAFDVFQAARPAAYYVSGGLGSYLPAETQTAGVGNTIGATIITLVSNAGAAPGGVILLDAPNGTLDNQYEYEIISVSSIAPTVIIPSPGLLASCPAGTNATFLGRRGSTMGAGNPANGQRAG